MTVVGRETSPSWIVRLDRSIGAGLMFSTFPVRCAEPLGELREAGSYSGSDDPALPVSNLPRLLLSPNLAALPVLTRDMRGRLDHPGDPRIGAQQPGPDGPSEPLTVPGRIFARRCFTI